MKLIRLLRLAAIAPALAIVVPPASGAGSIETKNTHPRLLAQYDFENIPPFVPNWGAGLGSTYKPATGWKTPFKVSLDTANPHSGSNALRFELLEDAGGEKILHSPAIKIPESPSADGGPSKLILHLYVRTQGVVKGGAGIRILERNAKGASIRLLENEKSLIPVPETPGWKELTAEGFLNGGTRSIAFMVVMYDQPAPATVWIDDVSLEIQSAPLSK